MEKKIWYIGLVIFFLFFQSQIFSQKISSEDFSKKSLNEFFPLVKSLSKEETKNLIFQIREKERKKYPDIDKFYFLISHLEEIKAVEIEQKRLESLNLVYLLGLVLLLFLLIVIFFKQRREIELINQRLK